ncbi:MAG: RnfABCDGE type electron transport complex subunit D [Candidatus Auribacterota bacterium]|nr:RnfABCDGE type electron transport complex subunit D [Candidatus Auribacterota bacterium]
MVKISSILRKQLVMRKVILATTPCIMGSIYFFGWRSLAVILLSCLTGFVTEYLFCKQRNEPASEAVFVTAIIFALIMPPTVPWHVVVIGMLFAVALSKEVFGGFGRNIFNPAMAGRCFVYICFPIALTAQWAPPAQGITGALTLWTTASTPDAITSATPMALMKALQAKPSIISLLIGNISGTMGVTSAILILIGGLYLYYTKTASRETILSVIISYFIINCILVLIGMPMVSNPFRPLLGGGFLFGAFFMATDPVSSPKTKKGRIVYGIIIAFFTVVIRNFSVFNGGLMFSVLLGNMLAPIIDFCVTEYEKKLKITKTSGAA